MAPVSHYLRIIDVCWGDREGGWCGLNPHKMEPATSKSYMKEKGPKAKLS